MANVSKEGGRSTAATLAIIGCVLIIIVALIFTSVSGKPWSPIPPSDATDADIVTYALRLIFAWLIFSIAITILSVALLLAFITAIIGAFKS